MVFEEPAAEPEVWHLEPGSLLSQLEAWTSRAQFHLIWKALNDFDLETAADFKGNFVEAVQKLFNGLHRSGHPLRVTVYTANNVLEVSEN